MRATAETLVRGGHPWIFSDSIKEQNREGAAGEMAVIFDRNDKFLAVGFYDPESPIRVRVIHAGKPVEVDPAFWERRFSEALAKRKFDARTTGYRCIHGESDGFPGLVLDRYADTYVLKIYAVGWVARLIEIVGLVAGLPNCKRVILRASRNLQGRAGDGEIVHGAALEGNAVFQENGIRFEADVLRGQKTGFFLDQRENREIVEGLAAGRDVLNAFSFSGGFSLYAGRGGAKSVTDLDISAHALESAKQNFALNAGDPRIRACRHETVQANTFAWLGTPPTRRFDLIVLDPPSLAKREAEKPGALRAYRQLATSALPWLGPKGILVAASCSAHVTPEEFAEVIEEVAVKNRLKVLRRTGNPADHPASFREARYLKAIYLERL